MDCAALFLLILFSQAQFSWSWSLFSTQDSTGSDEKPLDRGAISEFSMESLNNQKGIQLIENAKNKMLAPSSCWQTAYQNVFEGCTKTLADEERRARLAWHLSDCFQRHTGRLPFPQCAAKSSMKTCLKNLDKDAHKVYLEYFLETNSICHQLQIEAFKYQTERLVNDLKNTAEYAEAKFWRIEEHGKLLLENAKQVHDSLSSIDLTTQQVSDTSKAVEDHVNSVLKYSESVFEQSKGIAASQVELSESQAKMKANLAEGIVMLKASYDNLGGEIMKLSDEAAGIEKEILKVGDTMFSKMTALQNTADDIGYTAGTSLDKQKELLHGQSMALDGIQFLTKFQSQALEESRVNLQKLAEFGHKQQEELLQRQKELHQSHDHLVKHSKQILAAQEEFESKQARMFIALDKLFALHSAMLFESRVLMAFFMYLIAIFIIYMLTSIKQAYNVRHRLYLGLCVTFLVEICILQYVANDAEHQQMLIHTGRSLLALLGSAQYLYSIFTYRDYEVLNHKMLLSIIEKVNSIHGSKELLPWETEDYDHSSVNWSSWVEEELTEEANCLEDPDYLLPEEIVAENSSVPFMC